MTIGRHSSGDLESAAIPRALRQQTNSARARGLARSSARDEQPASLKFKQRRNQTTMRCRARRPGSPRTFVPDRTRSASTRSGKGNSAGHRGSYTIGVRAAVVDGAGDTVKTVVDLKFTNAANSGNRNGCEYPMNDDQRLLLQESPPPCLPVNPGTPDGWNSVENEIGVSFPMLSLIMMTTSTIPWAWSNSLHNGHPVACPRVSSEPATARRSFDATPCFARLARCELRDRRGDHDEFGWLREPDTFLRHVARGGDHADNG
jgi:hypothetical protein